MPLLDPNLWTSLFGLVPKRALLSLRIGAPPVLDQRPYVDDHPSYLRLICTHAPGTTIAGTRLSNYVNIPRHFCQHSRSNDATSGTSFALLNSNDVKVNSLLFIKGTQRFGVCRRRTFSRKSSPSAQLRLTQNCPTEKPSFSVNARLRNLYCIFCIIEYNISSMQILRLLKFSEMLIYILHTGSIFDLPANFLWSCSDKVYVEPKQEEPSSSSVQAKYKQLTKIPALKLKLVDYFLSQ